MHEEGINPELWDFPCHIVFKAMALNRALIEENIVTAIQSVLPGDYTADVRPSKKGNYVSVSVRLHLENKDQVEAVYKAVRSVPDVKMCL